MPNIKIGAISVAQEEDSPYWVCDIELLDTQDIRHFPLDKAFSVDFHGINYSLVADTRRVSRAMSDNGQLRERAAVRGVSPLILKSGSRANSVDYTADTNRLASTIVADLIGPVVWEILDWSIPAHRFSVSGVAPLDAAKQVVDAVGAMIVCDPDGTPRCRYRFPVSVPSFVSTPPALEVTGNAVHEWQQRGMSPGRWDCVTIRDVEPSTNSDRVEFEKTGPLEGIVRVYTDPWRANIRVRSSRNGVSIAGGLAQYRNESGRAEFKEGRAETPYPVWSLRSIDWLDQSLGGVSFDQNSRGIESAISGYSFAEVDYRTRSLDFVVRASDYEDMQLRVEEI